MKKLLYQFKYIICAVAMTAPLTGCSDFLDILPMNEVVLENYWTEKGDVTSVVNSCYESLENGDCITQTWSMFYKEFLPQMGYEASQETDYELYYDGTRPDIFCELWIPISKK